MVGKFFAIVQGQCVDAVSEGAQAAWEQPARRPQRHQLGTLANSVSFGLALGRGLRNDVQTAEKNPGHRKTQERPYFF